MSRALSLRKIVPHTGWRPPQQAERRDCARRRSCACCAIPQERSTMPADPARVARMFYEIHRDKKPLPPTPPEIRDCTLDEAYTMQEALHALWIPERGAIAGYKIALTTPVMQQLMGIDQ